MGDKMTYRVALDNKEASEKGKMADTWMTAAGQNGIPTAFLIDTTGHIAWIGHPMTLKEKTIEDVLAGTYDVKAAAAEAEKAKAEAEKNGPQLQQYSRKLQEAMQNKDWDGAQTDSGSNWQKLVPGWKWAITSPWCAPKSCTVKRTMRRRTNWSRQAADAHKDDADDAERIGLDDDFRTRRSSIPTWTWRRRWPNAPPTAPRSPPRRACSWTRWRE